jgi:hypothetical protein
VRSATPSITHGFADHVADRHRDPPVGQNEGIVPIAADRRFVRRGPIFRVELQRNMLWQRCGQRRSLHLDGDASRSLVGVGVVESESRAKGDLLRETHVVLIVAHARIPCVQAETERTVDVAVARRPDRDVHDGADIEHPRSRPDVLIESRTREEGPGLDVSEDRLTVIDRPSNRMIFRERRIPGRDRLARGLEFALVAGRKRDAANRSVRSNDFNGAMIREIAHGRFGDVLQRRLEIERVEHGLAGVRQCAHADLAPFRFAPVATDRSEPCDRPRRVGDREGVDGDRNRAAGAEAANAIVARPPALRGERREYRLVEKRHVFGDDQRREIPALELSPGRLEERDRRGIGVHEPPVAIRDSDDIAALLGKSREFILLHVLPSERTP